LICGPINAAPFGVTTNQSLRSHAAHPGWLGEAATSFIGKHRGELLAQTSPDDEALLAALLLYVTIHAPPWRSGRSLAATFPFAVRLISGAALRSKSSAERDGCYLAGRKDRRRFEIDDLTGDTLRSRTAMERARFLRDGDRLHILHRDHAFGPRPDARATAAAVANGGDGKGARGDEWPRGGGAGQARGKSRPASCDDAGGDEDGVCIRRMSRARCPLTSRRRAGDDREDRREIEAV
jgi:geranyl-CoA carboxylase alpha subunit